MSCTRFQFGSWNRSGRDSTSTDSSFSFSSTQLQPPKDGLVGVRGRLLHSLSRPASAPGKATKVKISPSLAPVAASRTNGCSTTKNVANTHPKDKRRHSSTASADTSGNTMRRVGRGDNCFETDLTTTTASRSGTHRRHHSAVDGTELLPAISITTTVLEEQKAAVMTLDGTSAIEPAEGGADATETEGQKKKKPYWTLSSGRATHYGHTCRECRQQILRGDAIFVRTGRFARFFYHIRCFSGKADPRTQPHSSYEAYKDRLAPKAPSLKDGWEVKSYGWHGTSSLGISPSQAPAAASIYELYARRDRVRRRPTFERVNEPVILTFDP